MRISCETADLQKAMAIVGRGVSTRSTLPILTGVMIEATKEGLQLMATDLEISMRMGVKAQVGEPGKAVLPAKLFSEIVRNIREPKVEINVDGSGATIISGKGRFDIKTYKAEEFPAIPEFVRGVLELGKEEIKEMIDQVGRAASRDEGRPVITGVLMDVNANHIKMVATDSYRLALREETIQSPNKEKFSVIVPVRSMNELSHILAGQDEATLSIVPEQNQILFKIGSACLVSRLIEGQYPSISQLLPEKFEKSITMDKDELLSVLKRVQVIAQNNVKMRFDNDQLIVSSETQGVGVGEDKLDIKFSGEPIEAGFNPTYFIDGLNAIPDRNVTLNFVSSVKPVVIKGEKSEEFTYLIMPVRA